MRAYQPYRDKPTDRQKVISERLAEKVKEETGLVVDPEIVRAVRWTDRRWPLGEMFPDDNNELEYLTAKAKLDRKLAYAAALVGRARDEFESSAIETDFDDDDDFGDENA